MEIIEYGNNNREACRSTAGYVLGLIASSLSFIVCFVTAFLIFLFEDLLKGVVIEFWGEIYDNIILTNIFSGFEKVFSSVLDIGTVFFWIITIGFILGFIGTLISWRKSTILSSLIMIIGGVLSIFCLIFPGIFLIIGGVLNMKCAVKNLKYKGE